MYILWLLFLHLFLVQCVPSAQQRLLFSHDAANAQNSTLDVFQVHKPLQPSPEATNIHTIILVQHVFGNSYGAPFVGNYSPPSSKFNNVLINLTVTSQGRQFDRLALLYFGDIEVFRTSTAEPTPSGIIWSYTKEMTQYLSLWCQPQSIIFDLGNLVNSKYTGLFNTTITATFYSLPESRQPAIASSILPISAHRSLLGKPSAFILPGDNATISYQIPSNTTRAFVSLSACGQATEEFWYSNALSSLTETFLNTTGSLYGCGSYREVQLLIDGVVAGFVSPNPTIFTGGIAPGLWKPEVGIDAFDLREPEVDITVFLPYLVDGKEHSFQIRIMGLDDNGKDTGRLSEIVGSHWVVTGKIFLFSSSRHPSAMSTLGHTLPYIRARDPTIHLVMLLDTNASTGANCSLYYSIEISHRIEIDSLAGSWTQQVFHISDNNFSSQGLTQETGLLTSGTSVFVMPDGTSHGFLPSFSTTRFRYRLHVDTTFVVFPASDGGGLSITASVSRGMRIESQGRDDISPYTFVGGRNSLIMTEQAGTANYSSQMNRSYSFGATRQDFRQEMDGGVGYARSVSVVNETIVNDHVWNEADREDGVAGDIEQLKKGKGQVLSIANMGEVSRGQEQSTEHGLRQTSVADEEVDVRARIGRGPGRPR